MSEIEKMREVEKDVMIAELTKASQLGRSTRLNREGKNKLNNDLISAIKRLRERVDNNNIKNSAIRTEIVNLSKTTGISIGQAQKVINVYLKSYCFLCDKSIEIIKELDCPLDSTTMKSKNTMKGVKTIEEYKEWQDKFEEECGIRILKDLEYDNTRLREFKGK